jgi:hypothetical protein
MPHLTLQEVIDRINDDRTRDNRTDNDRINQNATPEKQSPPVDDCSKEQPHHPEFYVPRITRRLASLVLGA